MTSGAATIATPTAEARVGPSLASTSAATETVAPSQAIPTPPGPGLLATTTVTSNEMPAGAVRVVMSGPPPIFRPNTLTATAGVVVLYLVNDSPARDAHGIHTLAIGREEGTPLAVSDEIKGGGRATFTVYGLEAGTYRIWCTFPGHAGLGQRGTLTVE
jgi:plastocyanin